MRRFEVWAPRPGSVAVEVDGIGTPMSPESDGWWVAEVAAGADSRYGFRLDGGPLRPDPRSRRQPDGVHGASQLFDPSRHRWRDGDWRGRQLAGSVIYELHIGTFTADGTLDAAVTRLDHLVALGVGLVELLPVNSFSGPHGWGYDGVDWFAVHESYGGPAAYQRFVDACHERGLAVIQDVVYNHLGDEGNYLPEFGPYLRGDAANTWGSAVNLDGPGSDEVRRFILDNTMMWFTDYHVDGLRLDAVHALIDTRALTLLEELAEHTATLAAELGRPLTLIAESDRNDPREVTDRVRGGIGLAASWNDDVHHAIHVAVTGETVGYYADFEPLSALAKVLSDGYFHDGTYSSFRGRHHGRPIDRAVVDPSQLVCSIQTHDQVGNRAAGDRLATQAGVAAQAVAAVLLLTAPFTPMLFMGEEWAASTPWPFFTSHADPTVAAAVLPGRLAEFARMGWDVSVVPEPQDPATFRGAILDWSEVGDDPHSEMLRLYRRLIDLRRTHPDLLVWGGDIAYDAAARWITIRRGGLLIAVNLGRGPVVLPAVPSELLVTTAPGITVTDRALHLPARSAAVLDDTRRASSAGG